jgi:hypothetical protein
LRSDKSKSISDLKVSEKSDDDDDDEDAFSQGEINKMDQQIEEYFAP